MEVKRVAVLGAGNGGITAAADFKHRGMEVALFELPRFKQTISHLKSAREIRVEEEGGSFSVELDVMTTDIQEAIKDAQVLLITIPAFAIEDFAKEVIPYLNKEQVVIIHSAACMGAWRFINVARGMGVEHELKVGELNTLAYGTRAFPESARVELSLRVKEMFFSALPARNTNDLLATARQLYDSIKPAENVWHTFLTNGNPEAHCACILNAGRIEYSKGEFYYYIEGITPHTINIIRAVDSERVALAKALGFSVDTGRESRVKRGYLRDDPNAPYEELFNTSPVFTKIKGPASVTSRYLVEDISNGLAMFDSLGKAVGVATPVSTAIVTLGSCLLQQDFCATGLTLENLGFVDMNAEKLNRSVW
jgi:opine dehydrogenase